MNIGIIGAGRVGCAFGTGLKNSGFFVTGVYSRSDDSQRFLCNKLELNYINDLRETVKNSEVILISVPDNSIKDVAEKIIQNTEPEYIRSKVFIHLSGALTSEVLELLQKAGAFVGSLHPVQTFADRENGWRKLYNIYYGFEGCDKARDIALGIIKAFDGKIIHIDKKDKPLYHMAACIISNYTVTLSHVAHKILENIGIDGEDAAKVFFPLIKNTVDNIEKYGSVDALTGPISRGDYKVVEEHIKALDGLQSQTGDIYKILGQRTVDLALKKGTISKESAEKLRSLLS
ncbi:MAG: DUF2520 domain-containing protein [Clostridium sp.]|jgi:predicted short-subunit dehydrogenase-like oxidoreductase (DUF2520 family)|nr:DUF2520 domain-containing protein [Clostridium sp.]